MGSLDSTLTRQALSEGVMRKVDNDANKAIRLRYIGTGTVTSVTVTTATDVEMITSDGGTDTYLWATYATMGAVVDAINADGIFEARALDVLRATASDDYFLAGAISSGTDTNGVVTWDMVGDTSGATTMALCLSPKGADWDGMSGHRVHLSALKYYLDLTAAVDSVQIWIRRGATETQVAGFLSVDTTETSIDFITTGGKLTGKIDDEIIVHIEGTLVNYASGYIQFVGIRE